MRTRRSNRVKSYVTQTYDFGEGSEPEEEIDIDRAERAQDNEAEDQDFAVSEGGASAERDQDDEDDFQADEEDDEKDLVLSSDAGSSASDLEDIRTNLRYRRHESKGERPAWLRPPGEYLSINPAPTDTHVPKGYAGYLDRNVRGAGLIRTWYGPDRQKVKIAAEILDRWIDWSLLPPREIAPEPGQGRKGLWAPDIFERESEFAERWLHQVYSERPQGITFSPVSFEEAQRLSVRPSSMPVMVGPSDSQVEVSLSVGQGIAFSESGVPFSPDDEQGKAPIGWLVDVGGTVLSLDWVPRRLHETQLLAVAIIPFDDHAVHNRGQHASQEEAEKHGIIQLWEFTSVKGEEDIYLPSASAPKLRKTIFTDQGRARRIRWNPACDLLAILSSSGLVLVVDFDSDDFSGAEHGKCPM